MSEVINTFLLDNPETLIPMKRDQFYAEQIDVFNQMGKPTRACEIVDVFIFNSHGQLLVQKRSYEKAHNPGLFDKSIGGHVRYGDVPDFTVMVESVQELQTPSIVLKNNEDFEKTLTLLHEYLATVAVIKHVFTKTVSLAKIIQEKPVVIANKVHTYLGLYDGSTRVADQEAQGILFYTIAELQKEVKKSPDLFTEDLRVLFQSMRLEIENFLNFIKK